jgi:hypothetical protein
MASVSIALREINFITFMEQNFSSETSKRSDIEEISLL